MQNLEMRTSPGIQVANWKTEPRSDGDEHVSSARKSHLNQSRDVVEHEDKEPVRCIHNLLRRGTADGMLERKLHTSQFTYEKQT